MDRTEAVRLVMSKFDPTLAQKEIQTAVEKIGVDLLDTARLLGAKDLWAKGWEQWLRNRTAMEILVPRFDQVRTIVARTGGVPITEEEVDRHLQALEDKFKVTYTEAALVVTTNPVTLTDRNDQDYDLGRFQISVPWKNVGVPNREGTITVDALEPNPGPEALVPHPYIRDRKMCYGEAKATVSFGLREGMLADVVTAIVEVLNTYEPEEHGPYVSLEDWGTHTCGYCGNRSHNEGSCECGTEYVCDSCLRACGCCDRTGCRNCLSMSTCRDCGHKVCDDCERTCAYCDRRICNDCVTTCDVCGGDFCGSHIRNLEGQMTCTDCEEKQRDGTENEDESEETAEVAGTVEPTGITTGRREGGLYEYRDEQGTYWDHWAPGPDGRAVDPDHRPAAPTEAETSGDGAPVPAGGVDEVAVVS